MIKEKRNFFINSFLLIIAKIQAETDFEKNLIKN